MSSTEQQIDDAVAKRHVQNTDTAQGAQSAELDMNLHKIIGLPAPEGDNDATNKFYVDNCLPGSGDVTGPDSATDNAIPLFNGITGKIIKDSVRLIEDTLMADNTDLPDGHAIIEYGAANWDVGGYSNLTEFVDQTAWRLFYSNADGDVTELVLGTNGQYLKSAGTAAVPVWDVPGGAGDVIGPASHTASYVPQWSLTPDNKTLVEGFAITAVGKALLDDATVAAQRTTLELGTAALGTIEDTLMADNTDLPDGHAIMEYGAANWGGGSSKWTDEGGGQYIYPNAGSKYRILDAGTSLATVTFAANTVYILAPGATFDVATSIIISNNYVSIIGDGATIKKTAQADGLRITGNYCRIVGVEIDGNSQGWAGIFVTGSHNTIDGATAHNNGGLGIGQDGQSTTCQYNRIVNCESFSNGEIGFSLNDVDFAVVSNNVSHGNTLEGYTCDANSPGWASGCMFDGNIGYNNTGGVGGFGIDRARNCTFSNNMIDGSGANDGMKTQNNQGACEYCVFSGNVLVNNGGYGINITTGGAGASNHCKLVGNTYHNNTSGDYNVVGGQSNIVIETTSSGDVTGPAGATIDAVPLFNGNTGKIIKDSTRLIEDTLMADNTDLPDGHAIMEYGAANWGGGSSKWTDESASSYYRPNNVTNSGNTGYRIYDAGYTQLGQVAPTTGSASPSLSASSDGTVLKLNHGNSGSPTNDTKPPLWVKRYYNYVGNNWNAGAAYFGCVKTGGTGSLNTVQIDTRCQGGSVPVSGGMLNSLMCYLTNDTVTTSECDIHNIVAITKTPTTDYSSIHSTVCIDLANRYADKGWLEEYYPGWTNALSVANEWETPTPCSCGMAICSGYGGGKWYTGLLVGSICYDSSVNKGEGIYFRTSRFNTYADCMRSENNLTARSGYNIELYYQNAIGFRTGRQNSYVDRAWIDNAGNFTLTNEFVMYNNKAILMKNTGAVGKIGLRLNAYNDWEVGLDGDNVVIGYGCSEANPLLVRINGANNQRLIRSPNTDSAGKHYVTID